MSRRQLEDNRIFSLRGSSIDSCNLLPIFYSQGDKALTKFSLFGGDSKYENARELYKKGGNQYKVEKMCKSVHDISLLESSHDNHL